MDHRYKVILKNCLVQCVVCLRGLQVWLSHRQIIVLKRCCVSWWVLLRIWLLQCLPGENRPKLLKKILSLCKMVLLLPIPTLRNTPPYLRKQTLGLMKHLMLICIFLYLPRFLQHLRNLEGRRKKGTTKWLHGVRHLQKTIMRHFFVVRCQKSMP